MNYQDTNAGRVAAEASGTGTFWTFELVQEAMVNAMTLWWRSPDRERGWHAIRAYWPEINRHTWFGDYADTEASPRPLPLNRAQVAEMEQVGEWLAFVDERDRKLVGMALAKLAAGHARVPWMELKRAMGVKFGADGLRMRYARAISAIAKGLNQRPPAEA